MEFLKKIETNLYIGQYIAGFEPGSIFLLYFLFILLLKFIILAKNIPFLSILSILLVLYRAVHSQFRHSYINLFNIILKIIKNICFIVL